ncbi:NUDIX domain protein [compost metagenome]
MIPNKACPVVLRFREELQILAFRHPLAGLQLVKGSIEPGESAAAAALRELGEEAGIGAASILADLGVWASDYQGQVWSFQLCRVAYELPEQWTQWVTDDGGHDFDFFWHPLAAEPSSEWHEVFCRALAYIRTAALDGATCSTSEK